MLTLIRPWTCLHRIPKGDGPDAICTAMVGHVLQHDPNGGPGLPVRASGVSSDRCRGSLPRCVAKRSEQGVGCGCRMHHGFCCWVRNDHAGQCFKVSMSLLWITICFNTGFSHYYPCRMNHSNNFSAAW